MEELSVSGEPKNALRKSNAKVLTLVSLETGACAEAGPWPRATLRIVVRLAAITARKGPTRGSMSVDTAIVILGAAVLLTVLVFLERDIRDLKTSSRRSVRLTVGPCCCHGQVENPR